MNNKILYIIIGELLKNFINNLHKSCDNTINKEDYLETLIDL